jgi:hypothetical protein
VIGDDDMKIRSGFGRRDFLKSAGIGFPGLALLSRRAGGATAQVSGVVYEARFVPDGAEGKVIFVSDHHYWPGHLENWGGGGQITTNCERRMPDLAEVLNGERPDVSIHGGDVISAGGSFYPPREEYEKQLAFAKSLYGRLKHPTIPMLGNHETADASYTAESELQPWIDRFGPPYRHHDVKGWRFLAVNCLLPNGGGRYGKGDGFGNLFGLDPVQLNWLRGALKEASSRGQKAVIFTHVPPAGWVNSAEFEETIVSAGCVKAVICGHAHRNEMTLIGGIPVLIRTANVTSPFGYTVVHLYRDGRIVVVQKSQHFPYDDFVSSAFQTAGPLGPESERYLTLGGASRLPLDRLKVLGSEASATIVDGHLRLVSRNERATVLIDSSRLQNARLTVTAVKAGGERMGGIALAGPDGTGGIEASLTSRYSTDGKVYLAKNGTRGREILARSWFNIGDNIAYQLTLEVRGGRVRASWKNMLDLEAPVDAGAAGQFGLFVDRGTLFVTDLRLESV